MKNETKFRKELIDEILETYPGAFVVKTDPDDIQGIPDRIILYRNRWIALETKRFTKASKQPNQDYYIDILNDMSYASFVYPENRTEVLYEIQRAFLD